MVNLTWIEYYSSLVIMWMISIIRHLRGKVHPKQDARFFCRVSKQVHFLLFDKNLRTQIRKDTEYLVWGGVNQKIWNERKFGIGVSARNGSSLARELRHVSKGRRWNWLLNLQTLIKNCHTFGKDRYFIVKIILSTKDKKLPLTFEEM